MNNSKRKTQGEVYFVEEKEEEVWILNRVDINQ
jgi:hypothetical protein